MWVTVWEGRTVAKLWCGKTSSVQVSMTWVYVVLYEVNILSKFEIVVAAVRYFITLWHVQDMMTLRPWSMTSDLFIRSPQHMASFGSNTFTTRSCGYTSLIMLYKSKRHHRLNTTLETKYVNFDFPFLNFKPSQEDHT